MRSHLSAFLRLAGLAVFLCGAALAQKILIEYDHDVDFSAYKSYDWKEHPFLKNNPKSRDYTVGAELVQSDVNQILMARGYVPVDADPQFYVTQFITARGGQEMHSVPAPNLYPGAYMYPGAWYTWSGTWFTGWDTYIEKYVEGILILDIVDAKTMHLIWRAACKAKVDDMSKRHEVAEKTVKKALKSFPPKPK